MMGEELSKRDLNRMLPKAMFFDDSISLSATVALTKADKEQLLCSFSNAEAGLKRKMQQLFEDNSNNLKITFEYKFERSALKSTDILLNDESNENLFKSIIKAFKQLLPKVFICKDFVPAPSRLWFRYVEEDGLFEEEDTRLTSPINEWWSNMLCDSFKAAFINKSRSANFYEHVVTLHANSEEIELASKRLNALPIYLIRIFTQYTGDKPLLDRVELNLEEVER